MKNIEDSFTCPCLGCTTQERFVPAMKFNRGYQNEARMRAKVEGWVGEMWVCKTSGVIYGLMYEPRVDLWCASHKIAGAARTEWLGTRHHVAMPEVPSFDTRTEAERACEAQHKINRGLRK